MGRHQEDYAENAKDHGVGSGTVEVVGSGHWGSVCALKKGVKAVDGVRERGWQTG